MTIAFFNEPLLKAAVMDRLREHRRLDQFVQGRYYPGDGRGCHLGCLTHINRGAHEAADRLFGIEVRVAHWLEAIFEHLPKDKCAAWVLESTAAIPVGADMSRCHHHFCVWLLGPSNLLTITNANRSAIERVRRLHERAAGGEDIADDKWRAAASAAWAASASVWAASASAAVSAAVSSAAWAAAAASAVSSASASVSASAVWAASAWATWEQIAAKSIEIFRAAPIVAGSPSVPDSVRRELCCLNLWCPDGEVVVV